MRDDPASDAPPPVVLRHGKAASDAQWGGSDRDRPLRAGPPDAAPWAPGWLGRPVPGWTTSCRPELVVCSASPDPQTADLSSRTWATGCPSTRTSSLYGVDRELLLRYLREIDEA